MLFWRNLSALARSHPPALANRVLSDLTSVIVSCLPQHTESLAERPESSLSQLLSHAQDRANLIQKPKEASVDRLRMILGKILDPGHILLKQNQPGHLLLYTSHFPPHTQRGQSHWKLPLEISVVITSVIGGQ